MRLRLSNPERVPELRQHFERARFVTNRLNAETIEAWRPDARGPGHERREIERHLAVWHSIHATDRVELVD
jgi:hypothetical protein